MDNAVAIVQTYLRLNGFLTATEFQVQRQVHDRAGVFETATDLDILAVRLPWSAEIVQQPKAPLTLAVDPVLNLGRDGIDVIIGEVKEGVGELNPGLRTSGVLHAAVRRAGCCPAGHLDLVVDALVAHDEARVMTDVVPCRVRLASFCGRPSPTGTPAALTVHLGHIVAFIQERLRTYAPILRGVAFKDPVLDLLKLLWKLNLEIHERRDSIDAAR